MQSPSRLREKPAALRQAYDLVADAQSTMERSELSAQRSHRPFCNCRLGRDRPTTQAITHFGFSGMSFRGQTAEVSQHSVGCAWRKSQKRQVATSQLIVTLGRSLGFQIAASLEYNFGAGGCSIAPKLEMNYIIEGDPAIPLVQLLISNLCRVESIEDADKHIARTERQIVKLFQDGQSSPYNRDVSGFTLLHVSHYRP